MAQLFLCQKDQFRLSWGASHVLKNAVAESCIYVLECQGHADCDERESLDRCGTADTADKERSKCHNRGCVRVLLFILDDFNEQEGFGSKGRQDFVGGWT